MFQTDFVSNGLVAQASNEKRKVSALTPEKSSPANRKCRRIGSLTKRAEGRVNAAKKSLSYSRNQNVNTHEKQLNDSVISNLNIDDLDTTKSFAVKVVIAYPNGRVIVKHSFDENALVIIRGICLSQWQPVVNAFLRHAFLSTELLGALEREVNRECKNYCQSDSCLKSKKPDQLSVFANVNVCREIKVYCPILSTVPESACDLKKLNANENERAINAIALATSTLIRCRNPTMPAIAYRMSTILFHSGVSCQDVIRLNHLGVGMSPKRMTVLQDEMGLTADYKLKIWKKTIENNKCSTLFLQEIVEKQISNKGENDMDLDVDLRQESIKDYQWYRPDIYEITMKNVEEVRERMNEQTYSKNVVKETLKQLKSEKLPYYK